MFGLAPDGTWGPYQTQAVPPSTVAWPVCGPVTFWPPSAALASAAVTTLQEVGPAAGAEAAELAAAGAVDGAVPGAGLVAGAGELQAAISAGAARLASTARPRHAGRDLPGPVYPGRRTAPPANSTDGTPAARTHCCRNTRQFTVATTSRIRGRNPARHTRNQNEGQGRVSELRCTRCGPAAPGWRSRCPLALRRRCTGCRSAARRGSCPRRAACAGAASRSGPRARQLL